MVAPIDLGFSMNLGERYYLGTMGAKYELMASVITGGHLEAEAFESSYFGNEYTDYRYYFVPDRVGFGEAYTYREGVGSPQHYGFTISDSAGNMPQQHAPVAIMKTISASTSTENSGILKELLSGAMDPDGDTMSVTAFSRRKAAHSVLT